MIIYKNFIVDGINWVGLSRGQILMDQSYKIRSEQSYKIKNIIVYCIYHIRSSVIDKIKHSLVGWVRLEQ